MEKYKRNPNTKCTICDKEIYKRPGQIKQNKGNVFCGQKCYGIYCRKEIPCLVCNKPILAGLNKKTCSRSCANKNRAGNNYKTGRKRDKVKSQKFIKKRLLEDRGKKCERCGFSNPNILHTHHKDRDRRNNKMSNLELLCPNCHAIEHLQKI